MYTSYFGNMREILHSNLVPISICAKVPNWYDGLTYKKVAPSYDILMDYKKYGNVENYVARFNAEILGRLYPANVLQDLINLIPQGYTAEDIVLLCYEKPEDFCHRHLVAQWFIVAGFDCVEFYNYGRVV